jgi:hypothetical protein
VSGAAAALGLSAPFKSFCVEGQQSISPGRHTFPTLVPIAASGLTGAGLVADFWRHYGPTTPAGFADTTDAAAFQLGLWELIGDGRPAQGAAAAALAGGGFKVTNPTAPAVARAVAWLNAWSNGTGMPAPGGGVALYVLQHPTRQDQVVWVPIPDPLPVVTVQVGPAHVDEDGPNRLVYTFTASAPLRNDVTVNYSVGGTATAGSDFTGLTPGAVTGSITIRANASASSTAPTATLAITPTADTVIEDDETVVITLASGSDYTIGSGSVATGTITNDDFLVDLDVDSDNDGAVARSVLEEAEEDASGEPDVIGAPGKPGVILPVLGARAKMVVEVPSGRTASLAIRKNPESVRLYADPTGGTPLSLPLTVTASATTSKTLTYWIQALAPSTSMADIVFELTTTDAGRSSTDTVRATAVAVDLDVDSDNDGTIDPDNGLAGGDDRIEGDPSRGIVVPVYAGDSDRDGLDDTRDFDGIDRRRFAPVNFRLSTGAAHAWEYPIALAGSPPEGLPGLTFTFTFSDAGFGLEAGGRFRLWKKDAPHARTEDDLIRSGVPIAASTLLVNRRFTTIEEYLENYGTTTLYLEAVSPSSGYEAIVVALGGTGAWANATTADTIHVRGLGGTLDLDVDSNNDEGFGVPKQRSAWEEKLETHPYAIGKLVMQSSPTLGAKDSVPEDRLAASFTPVVVALPKNLPMYARTIGVTFAMDALGATDSGKIRLWTRDKGPGLMPHDAAGHPYPTVPWSVFGHRVFFDSPYTLSQINYDPATGLAVLYMDGHAATRYVTLDQVERGFRSSGILNATLTFESPNARISLADDSVQYVVVRDDFFYRDFQVKPAVRPALASRGVYSFADMPNLALKRLTTRTGQNDPPGELQTILKIDANSSAAAMLYNDADRPDAHTDYPGFKAVLYQDYAAVADNTFVLAFGGTDDQLGEIFAGNPPDWLENLGQGIGFRIEQYRHAMDVARAVDAARRGIEGTMTTTGHSLGGGLASAASVVTGASGITFNAAGLHENTLRMYFETDPVELATALARYHAPLDLVTAYWVDWDFLSNFQDRYGLFVNPALGDRKKLDGPYDFALGTIQAIDVAFDTTAVAPVAGTLVKLGVDLAAKVGTGYLMIRAHSMDSVLYGLLVTENVVSANRDLLGYPGSRFR